MSVLLESAASDGTDRSSGCEKTASTNFDAAISGRGLRKSYGTFNAVQGVDFDISHGEIVAILGPNGAGKTTTVEMLDDRCRFQRGRLGGSSNLGGWRTRCRRAAFLVDTTRPLSGGGHARNGVRIGVRVIPFSGSVGCQTAVVTA